ncbi:uncharacterized protein LOC121811689 isoform X1 [Salvia splendens]|uniref:uncharacterized protein LOC121811689 isoform X1 n=1 Tax=Salvia splendens TaxID=180675 RepID=UPI001C27FCEC|nr:uncharacterized protein LOC121811689 isoform X1 [Salvia splendens]
MEDFVDDCHVEIDHEYEFDASQFFDFTRTEVDSEIQEVERWFQISGDYPNSPFIVELNIGKILSVPSSCNSSKPKKVCSSSDTDSRHGLPPSKKNAKVKGHLAVEDAAKPKPKASHNLSQTRSANFMEPTASHLAKKNAVLHDKQQSSNHFTRFQRMGTMQDEKINLIGYQNHATKRQKLETGFLNNVNVPREPQRGTLLRSQRQRSKNSSASSTTESQESKGPFKAQNHSHRKILQSRSLPPLRKSKTPLTEFQEFNFKTRERANHHSSAKENTSKNQESPLTEEFNKLSLGPKSKRTCQSDSSSLASSKTSPTFSGTSRSSHGSIQPELWTCQQRPNQHCGARAMPHQPNITRSLDIR